MRPEGRITRFAPSPTGPLHLGHAYSALIAAERSGPGQFLLRIEDIDQNRCRTAFEAQIFDDLRWLGLRWPLPVMRQSDRLPAYSAALEKLARLGVLYPCICTRGDIRAALSAPQEGVPVIGPDGVVYPGTCRGRDIAQAGANDALRLDMRRALGLAGQVRFMENGPLHHGTHSPDPDWMIANIGDVVLARRDMGTSYHLSVVVDDAAQGISEVTRGADLFDATAIHALLQVLLELPRPSYWHHDLIRDEHGKRLAKRDDARAIATYRAAGATPADIRAMVSL
ncbi:tRNA glutamyl-Q(34) synthetase GluQRS [Roseinatronobacter alkalisoli]|uniref:tRNA glutamyl-Q(34) synthetase GluQRS n=1 Tax=Roseinatronobacter alkalisoli TaxID=3028235 RepID=A0ABT5T5Y3_9RHOB|nr:tRNA glutamyl-Q(34) synthetase GluQRS [Roseinatronobacter sp. HJB301]MDD7970527.1 tRNA glutamyl-Q(34) synthetase GluQRS [Roseinatronobacter sp. HJB301]